jgi:hypothetical protein
MVENPETPFCAILGWSFSGDVLEFCSGHISARWSSIECRRRMAQKMVAEVGKSFCAILGWSFSGDVLNISRTTEKHYSTIEFKVIDVVYIASIPLYK